MTEKEGLRQRIGNEIDKLRKILKTETDIRTKQLLRGEIKGHFRDITELDKTYEEIKAWKMIYCNKHDTHPCEECEICEMFNKVLKALDSERSSEDVPKAQDSKREKK